MAKEVPCTECGVMTEVTGRYASRAKSTICMPCSWTLMAPEAREFIMARQEQRIAQHSAEKAL